MRGFGSCLGDDAETRLYLGQKTTPGKVRDEQEGLGRRVWSEETGAVVSVGLLSQQTSSNFDLS